MAACRDACLFAHQREPVRRHSPTTALEFCLSVCMYVYSERGTDVWNWAGFLQSAERGEKMPVPVVRKADLERALRRIKASGVREIAVSLPQIRWRDIGGLHHVKVRCAEISSCRRQWSPAWPSLLPACLPACLPANDAVVVWNTGETPADGDVGVRTQGGLRSAGHPTAARHSSVRTARHGKDPLVCRGGR
jgi:hypothetical protein